MTKKQKNSLYAAVVALIAALFGLIATTDEKKPEKIQASAKE